LTTQQQYNNKVAVAVAPTQSQAQITDDVRLINQFLSGVTEQVLRRETEEQERKRKALGARDTAQHYVNRAEEKLALVPRLEALINQTHALISEVIPHCDQRIAELSDQKTALSARAATLFALLNPNPNPTNYRPALVTDVSELEANNAVAVLAPAQAFTADRVSFLEQPPSIPFAFAKTSGLPTAEPEALTDLATVVGGGGEELVVAELELEQFSPPELLEARLEEFSSPSPAPSPSLTLYQSDGEGTISYIHDDDYDVDEELTYHPPVITTPGNKVLLATAEPEYLELELAGENEDFETMTHQPEPGERAGEAQTPPDPFHLIAGQQPQPQPPAKVKVRAQNQPTRTSSSPTNRRVKVVVA